MCYLIAKQFNDTGCVAVESKGGRATAGLVSFLSDRTKDKDIQILSVSDTEVYGEYKPYKFVKTEKDFIDKVLEMT